MAARTAEATSAIERRTISTTVAPARRLAVLLVAVARRPALASAAGSRRCCSTSGSACSSARRGLGIQFDDAELTARPRLRRPGPHPRRGRPHHPLVDDPRRRRPAAVLATVGIAVSRRASSRVAAHVAARPGLADRRCCSAPSSRSTDAAAVFSVLRQVPLPAPARRPARGGVGLQRRPGGHPRRRARPPGAPGTGSHAVVVLLLRGRRRARGRRRRRRCRRLARRAGCCAGSRCPRPACTRSRCSASRSRRYGAADVLHGSGFLAVYLAALVLGNRRLPHGAAVRGFAEALGWIAQIGLFVLLGLLADPAGCRRWRCRRSASGWSLLLLARPLSVLLSVRWFRVPLARAGVPVVGGAARRRARSCWRRSRWRAGVPASTESSTSSFVHRRRVHARAGADAAAGWPAGCGSSAIGDAVDLDVETAPLGALDADVLHRPGRRRTPGCTAWRSSSCGCRAGATSRSWCATGRRSCPADDHAPARRRPASSSPPTAARPPTERRVREVSAGGKLAGWRRPPRPRLE